MSMSLPLITFLYLYLFAVAIFILGSFFVLYHIIRFGFDKGLVAFCVILYLLGAIIVLVVSAIYIFQINWSTPINLTFNLGLF